MKTLLIVSLGLLYGGHGAGNSLSSGGFEKGINSVSSFLGGGVSRGYVSMKGGDGARGGFAGSGDGVRPSVYEGGHTGNGFADSGDKGHAI